MNKIFKTRSIKPMLVSLSIVGLSCLILSLIVFNGKYFQNRINCAYSPHKQIFLTCWFLLFAYFAACLFYLIKTNSEKDILFFFGMQLFTFALYMISVYCFAAYVTATVSGMLSVIFSARQAALLFGKKQYFLMSIILILVVLHLCCVFCGVIYCSLEYGIWKW